jgi:tetratricopeptide (TPR) repeat protein
MTEDARQQNRILLLISAALVVATVIAYEPLRHNDFVFYDDKTYITENPYIADGFTFNSVIWAFISTYAANWHPMTWLSHMLDYELYGFAPLGHHITNLILHMANTLLLLLLLRKMTGAIWKSAFVAAAFALHPVHVESVAWAAERKDVLSTLFWMLTLLAYVRYVRGVDLPATAKHINYGLVLIFFALGLMSKPMIVTLPFVLLLLDYWPLNRLPIGDGQLSIFNRKFFGLLYEKIPLFALSAASCITTFVAQRVGGSVSSLTAWPWYARLVNAMGSYFNYVVKILYPTKLAVLYPFDGKISFLPALAAILGMALLLYFWGRKRRWLIMGLLWYLGTLVPVIGLVQIGEQIMADRYTYIPSIGIFIIIAWGAEEIFSRKHYPRVLAVSAAAAVIAAMILATRVQTGYWRDAPTLFKRAIAVTKNNYPMLNNYGIYLCMHGNCDEGLKYNEEALRICPNYLPARSNRCAGLLVQNKIDEAIGCLNETLQMAGRWAEAYKLYYGLGLAYLHKDNIELAEINFKKALELRPDFVPARQYLALVQEKQKQKTPLR